MKSFTVLSGGGGAQKVSDPRFSHFVAPRLPVINDQSLTLARFVLVNSQLVGEDVNVSGLHQSVGNNVTRPWDIVFKRPISVYVIDAIDELKPVMFYTTVFHYAI